MPDWVVPTVDDVGKCLAAAERTLSRVEDMRTRGALAALLWVLGEQPAPITNRPPLVSREMARSESWAALCEAAGQDPPPVEDWRRLGCEPVALRRGHPEERESAYGTWRMLAVLLGVRDDPPVPAYSWISPERPHLFRPLSSARAAADEAARDRAGQDALVYWQWVRRQADATSTATA